MQAKKILVIKHGAFGDLIQALGAFQDIRSVYPDAHISLLTAPQFASMMVRCPYLDAVITDARPPVWHLMKTLNLSKRLKQLHADIVIDLQNSNRTRLYRDWFFKKAEWVGRQPSEPHPDSGLKGLIALFHKHAMPTQFLTTPDMSWMVEDVHGLLQKQAIRKPYVVLIPGASAAHPEKRWPYYGKLAQALLNLNLEVVSILGPDELGLAGDLTGHVLTGLSWFELAGVIQKADFVIGNDTGPCHLACAFNKPGFAIFGPTTSAARSELARGQFQTLDTHDLHALTVAQVLQMALNQKLLKAY